LSKGADLVYKTTDYWFSEFDRTVRWDDPSLRIRWSLPGGKQPILAAKDAAATDLQAAEVYP
jgi:dTDP-4-dehydrorhamnose 3,5-epimerase